MRITVRLHTILRRETPEGIIDRLELDLPKGATVAEAVGRLDIKTRPRTMLLVVNGKIVQEGQVLSEGDELRLVPGVSGGSCQLSATSALAAVRSAGRLAPADRVSRPERGASVSCQLKPRTADGLLSHH